MSEKHDIKMKMTLDRIESISEEDAKFCLKAMLLADKTPADTLEKAMDLAAAVRKPL